MQQGATHPHERQPSQLRARHGSVLVILAVSILVAFLRPETRLGISAVLLFLSVLMLVSLQSEWRWKRQSPPVPKFTQRAVSAGLRTMLRKDSNGQILPDSWRFLWRTRKRYWFVGTGCPPQELAEVEFERMNRQRHTEPVCVATAGDRHYWWWEDEFYWENEGYTSEDVRAVVLMHQRQKRKQLEHAHDLMALGETSVSRRREPIPEEVRRLVFRRDEGRCQNCGSTELLQYDHVIPFSLGGSNEAENLQLLCAPCNRAKSGRI